MLVFYLKGEIDCSKKITQKDYKVKSVLKSLSLNLTYTESKTGKKETQGKRGKSFCWLKVTETLKHTQFVCLLTACIKLKHIWHAHCFQKSRGGGKSAEKVCDQNNG